MTGACGGDGETVHADGDRTTRGDPDVTATDPELAAGGPADESVQTSSAAPGHSANRRRWLVLLAAVVALVSLLAPLGVGGIWDPHELAVAELARRIAVTVFGGTRLALADAQNTVPSLAELGRGELPFTSVAVGLRVLGLSAWAGRLPLALWGLVGLFATYAMLARLVDRAAAAFAVLCLSTTPLYFLQARTILGDVVTMASMALGVAGLGIACFDGSADAPRRVQRAAWLFVGTGGLVTGVMSRGVLLGAAPPALAVALAWWVRPRTPTRWVDRLSVLSGMVASAAGVVALGLGIWAFVRTSHAASSYSMLLGAAFRTEPGGTTHDLMIHQVGHAMFPWSALVPFGLAAALSAAPPAAKDANREVSARTTLGAVAVIAVVSYTLLGPYVGALPYGAVFALCALVGVFLRDLERGAHTSRALAMATVAVLVLLSLDFRATPDTGMRAFVVEDAVMPASYVRTASAIVRNITVLLGVAAFFTLMERESRPRFQLRDYLAWPRALRDGLGRWLVFTLVECALLALAAMEVLSRRGMHVHGLSKIPSVLAAIVRYAWLVWPPLVVATPIAVLFVRDVFRWLFASESPCCGGVEGAGWLARWRPSRALGAALAFTAAGGVLSLVYYPGLMTQLSPDQAVHSFGRLARPNEPLAMLGVSPEAAAYLVGEKVKTFSSDRAASTWLSGEGRRWLVAGADKLSALNSTYRQHASPRVNLPVLDARSSRALLVSNQRRPSERDQNPFDSWILTDRPQPKHSVTGQLEGQLYALGWDLTTLDGRNTDALEAGRAYRLTLFWQVLNPILTTWRTFVHIDGQQRRLNADHDTLEGKYPMHLLLTGDFFADTTEFTVEPNFGPGVYELYYGLYRENQRMRVESGRHDNDRILGGPIRVR
ncbi:MAG: glycosyltransferase family 39 protein [Polyangiaceae bacterium]|nr:glycosyltransferase family 39 protein [Polyangiaceae bacterium]